jgi:hypothetical protein
VKREESLPRRRPVGRPVGSNRLLAAITEAETRHELAGLRPRRRKTRKPAKPPSMLDAVLALTEAGRPREAAAELRRRRKRRRRPVRRIDQFSTSWRADRVLVTPEGTRHEARSPGDGRRAFGCSAHASGWLSWLATPMVDVERRKQLQPMKSKKS